jgi:hypothetical protein
LATVVVTATAERNLRSLIETHSLPASTADRVWASIEPLRPFPSLGAPLAGRWSAYRFVLGPWRWMLIVYRYEEELDRVMVITIRDARSGRSPRHSQP